MDVTAFGPAREKQVSGFSGDSFNSRVKGRKLRNLPGVDLGPSVAAIDCFIDAAGKVIGGGATAGLTLLFAILYPIVHTVMRRQRLKVAK